MPCKSAKQCFLNQIHYLQVSIVVKIAFFLDVSVQGEIKNFEISSQKRFYDID